MSDYNDWIRRIRHRRFHGGPTPPSVRGTADLITDLQTGVKSGLVGATPGAQQNRELLRQLVSLACELLMQLAALRHPTNLMAGVIDDHLVSVGYDPGEVRRYTDMIRGVDRQIEAIRAKEVTVRFRKEGA